MKEILPASRPEFCAAVVEELVSHFAGRDDIAWGRRFGFPAFFVRGRRFAYVCARGVVAQLPEADARQRATQPDISTMVPVGGPRGSTWVLIARERAEDYPRRDAELLEASIAHVGERRR